MASSQWLEEFMMALCITTSIGSLVATSFAFIAMGLLHRKTVSSQQKMVLFVLVADFIKACNMLWWTLYNRGQTGMSCSLSSACKFAGFVWMFVEVSHALFSLMICVSMYRRYRNFDDFCLFDRFTFRFIHGAVLVVIVAAVLAITPVMAGASVHFGNYGWWVSVACRRGGGAFFFLMFPILACEVVCAGTAIANARLVMSISGSAPIASEKSNNQALKQSVVRKMVIFPFAFCITWMPICVFHILFFAKVFEVHSPGGMAIAPFVVVLSTMSGMVDTALFLYVFRIIAKLRSARMSCRPSSELSLEPMTSTSGTKSTESTRNTM